MVAFRSLSIRSQRTMISDPRSCYLCTYMQKLTCLEEVSISSLTRDYVRSRKSSFVYLVCRSRPRRSYTRLTDKSNSYTAGLEIQYCCVIWEEEKQHQGGVPTPTRRALARLRCPDATSSGSFSSAMVSATNYSPSPNSVISRLDMTGTEIVKS